MSQKYEKLKTLLRELFQLDQPDLDFGLYRIMHAKSAEISQFLDEDLLPQVRHCISALHEDRQTRRSWRRHSPTMIAGVELGGDESRRLRPKAS